MVETSGLLGELVVVSPLPLRLEVVRLSGWAVSSAGGLAAAAASAASASEANFEFW